MKIIKMLITGLMMGFATGMWFGVNIGKGQPILSNPFVEQHLQQKLKQKVGESIEKLGEDIKGKMKQ